MNNNFTKTILVSVFLASTIWVGFNAFNSSDNTSQQELNDLKTELETLKNMLTHKTDGESVINKINREMELTHTQLQKIKSEQLLLSAQSGSKQNISNDAEINENFDDQKTAGQIALQEKIAMEEEAIEIGARISHLKTELDQESIDEKWGPEIEQSLSDNFANNAPEGSSLLETDCRSTFCRITIANDGDTDFNPRDMLGELFTSSEGFYNSTVDDDGKKITELYVSRNGHDLPAINPVDSL